MEEEECKNKLCPIRNEPCVGLKCMAWKMSKMTEMHNGGGKFDVKVDDIATGICQINDISSSLEYISNNMQ